MRGESAIRYEEVSRTEHMMCSMVQMMPTHVSNAYCYVARVLIAQRQGTVGIREMCVREE